jgi:hypothetical protein
MALLTTESVVWATREGAFVGIGPASLMPILAHPFVYRDALYFESTGLSTRRLERS